MKIETKVLIVMIIMILSVGPVTYFFAGTPQEIELPDQEEDKPIFHEFSGNVTGEIVEIQPYLSYVGVSWSNDERYVRWVIDKINYTDNYTLETSLNPAGQGYRYSILMVLDDISDATEVGFRLNYRLSTFFSSQKPPVTLGKVGFPLAFQIGNETIYAKENQTALTMLLYSNKKGEHTTVFCPKLVTSLNYNLTRVPELCLDLTQGMDYGLSFTDIWFNQEKKNLTMSLEITKINNINFEAEFEYGENITREMLEAELPDAQVAVQEPLDENQTGNIIISSEKIDEAQNIRSVLESYDITIREEYKVGTADLPDLVVLDEQPYDLMFDTVNVKLDFDAETGDVGAVVTFTVLFKEVVKADIEEI